MVEKEDGRRTALIKTYKRLFATDDGKKVLKDLSSRHYLWSSTYSVNPHEMAIKEGQRNVILFILSRIGEDLDELQNMAKEIRDEYRNPID